MRLVVAFKYLSVTLCDLPLQLSIIMRKYNQNSSSQEASPTKKPNIVRSLIVDIMATYLKCNANYSDKGVLLTMRPVITEPHEGVANQGLDNADFDYIFRKGDIIKNQKKNALFQVLYLLGKGTFGQVLCCRNQKGQKIAIKVIKSKQNYQKQALFEAKILKTLNKYEKEEFSGDERAVVMVDVFMWRKHLCIVFQTLQRNLYDLLKEGNFEGVNLMWIQYWTKQIVEGLFRIHQLGIIHCDLKPENIMFKKQKTQETVRLIDFGSSCFQKEIPYKYIQSRFYRAPEVILGMDYSTKIDMWSLGCILVELYIGLPLFPGSSSYDMLRKMVSILGIPRINVLKSATNTQKYFNLKEGAYELKSQKQFEEANNIVLPPSKNYYRLKSIKELRMVKVISEKGDDEHELFFDFVEKLLQFDPRLRMSSKEALEHQFLRQANFKSQN